MGFFSKKRVAQNVATMLQPQPPQMSRQEKVLFAVKRDGIGIEIGPSHRPVAPKSEGFNVTIIDHLDKQGLIEKYTHHGIDTSRIEDVDLIWNGERYAELTGKKNYYDWILACHLIEHTPDLIGFIQQCEEVLNERGAISLIIPDKRYCFDRLRPKTGIGAVIDAFHQKRTIHSEGTAAEYHMNVVALNGTIAWTPHSQSGALHFVHPKGDALESMRKIRDEQVYVDLHAWTFTPNSFRLIMNDLYELGFITLREECFFETEGHEFYVTLSRTGKGPGCSRIELATAAFNDGY
jgi:hypothetical protein